MLDANDRHYLRAVEPDLSRQRRRPDHAGYLFGLLVAVASSDGRLSAVANSAGPAAELHADELGARHSAIELRRSEDGHGLEISGLPHQQLRRNAGQWLSGL